MPKSPQVSVVIPSYNGERYIAEAAGSILAQTYTDLELVVVDDGSTDGTCAILRALADHDSRLRLVEKSNEGLIATLNRGVAEARGRYIARLDHDDISRPTRIAAQSAFLDTNPDFIGVGCLIENVDADGHVLARARIRHETLVHAPAAFPPRQQWLYGPTPMIRADALREVGGYRTQFLAAEDRDLCWRLGAIGRLHRLPLVLVEHRIHAGNMSRLKRRVQIFSALLADLSAICNHLGLDDSAIVARIDTAGDYPARVADYAGLIGPRYPVETYRLYMLLRVGAWDLAGYGSRGQAFAVVMRHLAERAWDRDRLLLARRVLRFLRKSPALGPHP